MKRERKRFTGVGRSLVLLRSGCSFARALLSFLAPSRTPGSRGVCGCREQLVVEKHPRSLSHHPLSTLCCRCRCRRARRHRVLFHPPSSHPRSRSRSHDTHLRAPMVRTVFHGSKRLRAFELYERVNARGYDSPRARRTGRKRQ